jgi:hypothetical protein
MPDLPQRTGSSGSRTTNPNAGQVQPTQRPGRTTNQPASAAQKPSAEEIDRAKSAALAGSGGRAKMAFVFIDPDVYGRIEQAAMMDEEKVGNWMSRVLDEASQARIDYTTPTDDGSADAGEQNAQ